MREPYYRILTVLNRTPGREMTGFHIVREDRDHLHRSSIYSQLGLLEKLGLITCRIAAVGGHGLPLYMYRITEKGITELLEVETHKGAA